MQTSDETEDDEEYYDEEGLRGMMQHGGKKVLYTVAYFLLLAALMYPSQRMHLGEQGVFFSLVGAGILLALIVLLWKFVSKKIASMRMTGRQFFRFMVGYQPEVVESTVADDTNQGSPHVTPRLHAPATLTGRELVPLGTPFEEDEDPPESIIEENGLCLSDRFIPSIQSFLGQIMLVCGLRRFGKSNFMAVFAEELARFFIPEVGPGSLPMLIVDTEDEYGPLANRQYLPRGFTAGSPDLRRIMKNSIGITVSNAYAIGQNMLEQTLQVVLNMKSYLTDEEAALVLCELIRGMNAWEEARPNKERLPVMLLMDEASKWLPQDMRESSVSKETQHLLYKTFFGTVVNRGGKRGWGAAFACQRIQQIHKSALQAPWKFLFYQTQKVDLEQYETFGLQAEDVLTLRQGECFIFSPSIIGFRTFIRERTSPHLGHTPGIEALIAHRKHLRPVQTLSFDSLPTDEEADRQHQQNGPAQPTRAVNETAYREQIGYPSNSRTTARPDAQHQHPPLTQKQQFALELVRAGRTTVNDLAAAMTLDGRYGTVSATEAYKILGQLDTAGYITRNKKAK